MDHELILRNRANITEKNPSPTFCTACDEPLVFAMRDKEHTFSLGLLTILECISLAENEGFVPELPSDWWISVTNAYGKDFKPL